MKIGKIIKSTRKKEGIQQKQLAADCGITPSYLSQIENGLKEPNISTLEAISKSLNIPLPILFYLSLDESDIPEEKRDSYKQLFPSINALIEKFFNLDLKNA